MGVSKIQNNAELGFNKCGSSARPRKGTCLCPPVQQPTGLIVPTIININTIIKELLGWGQGTWGRARGAATRLYASFLLPTPPKAPLL